MESYKNILIFPGFITDTWSSIEERYVGLDRELSKTYNLFWLVPPTGSKHSRCIDGNNRYNEPIFVTKLKDLDANLIECELTKYNLLKNVLAIRTIIKKYNICAVYTHFGYHRYYVELASRLSGIVVIKGEHTSEFAAGRKYKFIKRIFWKLTASYYIPVSKFVDLNLRKEGLVTNNSHVVYNGFDFESFPKLDRAECNELIVSEFNLPRSARIVSCIARVDSNKNQLLLIEMMRYLAMSNLYLFLVGNINDKSYVSEVEASIERYSLERNVIITGYRSDVHVFMAASELTFLPSFTEALGNVVIESYYYETPVISTNFQSLTEIIDHGVSGYCIDPLDYKGYASYANELLNDNAKRMRFGQNGKIKVVGVFSKDAFVKETLRALSTAIS